MYSAVISLESALITATGSFKLSGVDVIISTQAQLHLLGLQLCFIAHFSFGYLGVLQLVVKCIGKVLQIVVEIDGIKGKLIGGILNHDVEGMLCK